MKPYLPYCVCVLFVVLACNLKNPPQVTDNWTESVRTDTIQFVRHVEPIFIKNCSPCHFTGGKMYERLPFDKDTTILNHHESILKRIKNEEENTILKNFVLQNKNGLPKSKPSY